MKDYLINLIKNQGFVLVGSVNKQDANFGNWIEHWLRNGYQADMNWLDRNSLIRETPCAIEPYGESIITLAYPYYTNPPKMWETRNPISNYAWGQDYHKVLKRKIKTILQEMKKLDSSFIGRGFVDSAPLPEKILAKVSGLGWIGKNSMLINKTWGSYLFLAEVVCNYSLPTTPPTKNRCGSCVKCIDACPTSAILEDGAIDSGKCISYLTIENKKEFTNEQKLSIDYQLFGCDICQQVCPWNRKPTEQPDSPFRCFDRWLNLSSDQVECMTEPEFELLKQKSPIKRLKLEGLKRNASVIVEKRRHQGFD